MVDSRLAATSNITNSNSDNGYDGDDANPDRIVVVEMHPSPPTRLRFGRGSSSSRDKESAGEDDVDGELVKRLLSPQGALAADLASHIVDQLTSEERRKNLASMSRRRYAATQCVTVFVALLTVGVVVIVSFSNNEALTGLLLRALNRTLESSSAADDSL